MKFDIKSRWTGKVIFTAEITASEWDSYGVKLGLAVKVAVNAGANMAGADMAGVNMAGANMTGANMAGAYMTGANMAGAYMAGANMTGAYMAGVNMAVAYMAGANMTGANMTGANMAGAYMAGANMTGANLWGVSGLNRYIKCVQIEDWPITYTHDVMQIGCQRHAIDAWRGFSDAEIRAMDGLKALTFWRKWKSWIFQAIEMAPAEPTNPKRSEDPQ